MAQLFFHPEMRSSTYEKTTAKKNNLLLKDIFVFLERDSLSHWLGRLLILLHVPLLKAQFVAAEAGQEIPKIEPMTILKPTRPKKPQSPPKKQKKYHFFERQLEGG